MFKKLKSYNQILKFIRESRKKGKAQFKILTTGREIIIINEDKKQLRINAKL